MSVNGLESIFLKNLRKSVSFLAVGEDITIYFFYGYYYYSNKVKLNNFCFSFKGILFVYNFYMGNSC
jgi:hypothetical protein